QSTLVKHRKQKGRITLGKILILFGLLLFACYIILPLMWMLSTTLRHPLRSFALPPAIFPTEFDLSSYATVFQKVDFELFIWNSAKVALLGTFLQLVCSTLAAFAFARIQFRGRNAIFILFISALMIPSQVIGIPRFIMLSKLHLMDNHAALIIPAMFSALGIFLIRQYMMTIPKSYDEAAYIDGASLFYCYYRIILPMSKPAIMVIAVQSFIASWNDFYGPLIYLNSLEKMTLPLGLTALRGMLNTGSQATIIAGVVLSLLAPLLFYLFGQRYLVEGTNLGGLK
ncbi:MAG TPA: carbohydrate ABC transporter permease, partial [Clostridia bacterium]|nr:carbohydrate ABC transporter permease [Clostridia bacterium]